MNWQQFIKAEEQQDYYQAMMQELTEQRQQGIKIFPAQEQIFNALELTPFNDIKVVILGQDPYHGEGQAHGLAFSVNEGVKIPPSLRNIYKELSTDINGFQVPEHGNLNAWAKQGVLLLNTVLTVQQSKAHSHAKIGWEQFTDNLITQINEHQSDVVFILWGAHAQKKGRFINIDKHTVLSGAHPSPLSAYRGFFGCQHFSKTNEILLSLEKPVINWQPPLNSGQLSML